MVDVNNTKTRNEDDLDSEISMSDSQEAGQVPVAGMAAMQERIDILQQQLAVVAAMQAEEK